MNFNNFMRKLDGVEDYEATNCKTEGARPLNMQGINDFARSIGSPLPNLEERSAVSRSRVELFWAGYNGSHYDDYSVAMGLYGDGTPEARGFFALGDYYKSSFWNTHSQQQDPVSSTVGGELTGSYWYPSSSYLRQLAEYTRADTERTSAMGSQAAPSQPREEPERSIFYTTYEQGETW